MTAKGINDMGQNAPRGQATLDQILGTFFKKSEQPKEPKEPEDPTVEEKAAREACALRQRDRYNLKVLSQSAYKGDQFVLGV
jgi:hypothetical protein